MPDLPVDKNCREETYMPPPVSPMVGRRVALTATAYRGELGTIVAVTGSGSDELWLAWLDRFQPYRCPMWFRPAEARIVPLPPRTPLSLALLPSWAVDPAPEPAPEPVCGCLFARLADGLDARCVLAAGHVGIACSERRP